MDTQKARGFLRLKEDQAIIDKGFSPDREHRDHGWSQSPGQFGVAVLYHNRDDARLFDCHSLQKFSGPIVYKCNNGIPSKGETILAVFHISKPEAVIIRRLADIRPERSMEDYNGAL